MQRKLTLEELVKFGQSHNYTIKAETHKVWHIKSISWYSNGDASIGGSCDTINEVFNEISNDISLKKNPTGERLKVIFPNE